MSSSLDSAKNAVKSFLSKDGKHDTTVHTSTSPAVTNETVDQHRHDNVVNATDREIHQDHYHTTVQPIHDTQKLKEQHHFNTAPVEERKFEHGNDDEVQRRLHAEQDKFRDTTRQGETKHTTSVGGNLVSEHVHHHVHENIQPVVQRQTIEPHVVHTTVPVHETHHSAAQHHSTSNLPPVSLEQFKAQGGTLGGHKDKTEFFEGEPRDGAHALTRDREHTSDQFRNTGHTSQHAGGAGGASGGVVDSAHSSPMTGKVGGAGGHHGDTAGHGTTAGQHHSTTAGTGVGSSTTDSHTSTKPSLLNRINPLKDADHDGKKGFMD